MVLKYILMILLHTGYHAQQDEILSKEIVIILKGYIGVIVVMQLLDTTPTSLLRFDYCCGQKKIDFRWTVSFSKAMGKSADTTSLLSCSQKSLNCRSHSPVTDSVLSLERTHAHTHYR